MSQSTTMSGVEARKAILKGMSLALEAVQLTYGPCGWTVAVDYRAPQIRSTKCGVSVLDDFNLPDPCEDAGVHLLCHVAQQMHKYAGDGTTLAAVLAYAISAEAYSRAALRDNHAEVCRGIRLASQMVERYIGQQSRPLSAKSDLYAVARSSAGLDDPLAELIVEGYSSVRDPSAVFLLPAHTSSCEVVNGLLLDGHFQDRFDHPRASKVLVDAGFLIYLGTLETWGQISHQLLEALATGADVILAAQRICPTFLDSVPSDVDRTRLNLVSLAVSRLPCPAETIQQIVHGREASFMRRLAISNDRIFIELSATELTDMGCCDKAMPAALISVGEVGDTASRERMERALKCAASVGAAARHGYVPGGGGALVDAAHWLDTQTFDDATEAVGADILRKALLLPAQVLTESAGELAPHQIETMLRDPGIVFDLRERRVSTADVAGVLDATSVVVAAVRVASSIAGLIALTEVLVGQLQDRGSRAGDRSAHMTVMQH